MYQQLTIIGNIGRVPELRYTPSGTPVLGMSVATNRSWQKDGEWHERTTWFRVSVWNATAERLAKRDLKPGAQVLVVGELEEPSVWTDKEGNNRASLEMRARMVRVLSADDREPAGEPEAQSEPVDQGVIPF